MMGWSLYAYIQRIHFISLLQKHLSKYDMHVKHAVRYLLILARFWPFSHTMCITDDKKDEDEDE